ncbi:PIN domain-containing protein [Priestia aryabhattai]
MREIFFPFFKYNDETINRIWENGIIIIDTNALLNTYRMHSDARKQFFDVLHHKNLNPKLWMPYQIGWEFFRNRKKAIDESLDALKFAKEDIKKGMQKLSSIVTKSGLKYHEDFLAQVQQELDEFNKKMEVTFRDYNKKNKNRRSDFYRGNNLKEIDPIVNTINSIFRGKYAEPVKHKELLSHYTQGEFRFSLAMPPGYEDEIKGDYRKFGDFIIWEEMIKKALSSEKPIIFVTEDHKKDWWQTDEKTHKKSPLPELIKEFKDRTDQLFYMYSYKEFIEEAKKRYPDLPATDKVTKQMDLATEETELKEKDSLLNNILQEQMNKGNSSIANAAYRQYIGTPLMYDAIGAEARAAVQHLYQYNPDHATGYTRKIENIMSRDSSEMKIGYELLKIVDLVKKEIATYEYRN